MMWHKPSQPTFRDGYLRPIYDSYGKEKKNIRYGKF